jgi:hypothetical protein
MIDQPIGDEESDRSGADEPASMEEQTLDLFEHRYGPRGTRGGRNAAERQAAWAAKMRSDGFVQVAVWIPAHRRHQLQQLAKSWSQAHFKEESER